MQVRYHQVPDLYQSNIACAKHASVGICSVFGADEGPYIWHDVLPLLIFENQKLRPFV
jgi:hypothetical protein